MTPTNNNISSEKIKTDEEKEASVSGGEIFEVDDLIEDRIKSNLPLKENTNNIEEIKDNNNNTIEKTSHKHIILISAAIFVTFGLIIGYWVFSSHKNNDKNVSVSTNTSVNGYAPVTAKTPVETFVVNEPSVTVGSQKENITTADIKIFKKPENFKSFSYDETVGKKISISGNCKDNYYAMLIFASKDDYRTDPGKAQSNRAFPCPANKSFSIDMDLKDINLQSGSYYIFIADQGDSGSWYNPR